MNNHIIIIPILNSLSNTELKPGQQFTKSLRNYDICVRDNQEVILCNVKEGKEVRALVTNAGSCTENTIFTLI